MPVLLHVAAINKLVARLGRRNRAYTNPPISDLADEIEAWQRRLPWPWRFTCLKRATILYALLKRSGEDVQLQIGVKRDPDRTIAAHAWLMRNGQPYLEPTGSAFETFQVITEFPDPHSTSP